MNRSSPCAEFSLFSRQFSAPGGIGSRNPINGHALAHRPHRQPAAPSTRRCSRHKGTAFTLIELLVVIAILAVLASLALSTLGYVNRKSAESRARSEVAALSAAIESFKLDTGSYPSNAVALYSNLCSSAAGSKVYFEPNPRMITTNNGAVRFVDPWGNLYEYMNYSNFFELWSTANGSQADLFIKN